MPEDRLPGPTEMNGQLMTRLYELVPKQPLASAALTLIGNVPVWVGVPERTPAKKVIPVGRLPYSVKIVAPTPALWVKVTGGYTTPAVPEGIDPGPTLIVGQLTIMLYASVPKHPFESVALTMIGNVPVWVAVPDKSPPVERLIPVGNVPVSVNVIVPTPPVWVNVAPAKTTPAVPEGMVPGPTLTVGQLITRL